MSIDKKNILNLITMNTEEIITPSELQELLENKKHPIGYWGTAPTGKIHIGYLIPLLKIVDLLDAGFSFKILIADLHAYLDDKKTPWDLLEARTKYYEELLFIILKELGSNASKLKFVKGRSFQLTEEYQLHLLKLTSIITVRRARRAGAEVVRQVNNPKMSSLIYPMMQCIDVAALNADVAFGGIDQRGIYILAREVFPEIGYKKPICIFSPLLPSLLGGKMSSSEENSIIDCLDSKQVLEKKINKARCPAKILDGNSVIALLKMIIFPWLVRNNKGMEVERLEKYGGSVIFENITDLIQSFTIGALHPVDLKIAVVKYLDLILRSVREKFGKKTELLEEAYP